MSRWPLVKGSPGDGEEMSGVGGAGPGEADGDVEVR